MALGSTDLAVAIGREVAAWRHRRGWTQAELAERAGITRRQLGKIERGEAGQLAEVLLVTGALGVPMSRLAAAAEDAGDVSRSAARP